MERAWAAVGLRAPLATARLASAALGGPRGPARVGVPPMRGALLDTRRGVLGRRLGLRRLRIL